LALEYAKCQTFMRRCVRDIFCETSKWDRASGASGPVTSSAKVDSDRVPCRARKIALVFVTSLQCCSEGKSVTSFRFSSPHLAANGPSDRWDAAVTSLAKLDVGYFSRFIASPVTSFAIRCRRQIDSRPSSRPRTVTPLWMCGRWKRRWRLIDLSVDGVSRLG